MAMSSIPGTEVPGFYLEARCASGVCRIFVKVVGRSHVSARHDGALGTRHPAVFTA